MPRKNFKDLRADLANRVGEERVAGAEHAEFERYELEQLALGDIRRARALTQTQLANALGVSQAQVSRLERQSDLFLSTLASYIEAMGGELELIASFSDDKRVAIEIGEMTRSARAVEDSLADALTEDFVGGAVMVPIDEHLQTRSVLDTIKTIKGGATERETT